MKKLTVALLLILCAVLCIFSFTSCSKKKKGTVTEAPPATTDKWEPLGAEIKAYSADDRTLRIQMSAYGDAEKTSRNDKYIEGPDEDAVNKKKTDTIGKLIWERNTRANQVFGTTVQYIYWDETDLGWGKQAGKIVELVQAADPQAPDMYIDMLYDLNKAMLSKGVFKDVWSLPGSYFDFSADGWMTEWMESLSFTGDRAYILGSDYFIDFFRNMGVLPFNAALMDENGSKLAKALFGEDLADGETMSQRFFDYVEEGKWTWASLKKLCEAIWVDNAPTDQDSLNDTLGIIIEAYSGMPATIALYSTGESLTEVKTVNGVQTISYPDEPGALKEIFNAISDVFKGNGSFVTNVQGGGSTEDKPGIGYHYIKFAENTLLFTDPSLLGTLEDDVFQQMMQHYLYSVVPLPKLSEYKMDGSDYVLDAAGEKIPLKYNTVIHNTADVGAISVRTTGGKARVLSAYMQFCAENSGAVRKEYLEVVTKFKTTDYNQGTDRMLDLIYDSVITARDKALDDAIDCLEGGREVRFHQKLKGGDAPFENDASFIASEYTKIISTKSSLLGQVLTTWRNLPTGDTVPADLDATEGE